MWPFGDAIEDAITVDKENVAMEVEVDAAAPATEGETEEDSGEDAPAPMEQ